VETDDHYYATGYDAKDDPYALANGVLINHFGLTDFQSLNEIEADISSVEIARLLAQPSALARTGRRDFDRDYLCHLHHEIFGRIYPWSGQFRQIDIGKGDTLFLPHKQIEIELAHLFVVLQQALDVPSISLTSFSEVAGTFLVHLNFIHPFREGNGRVQRLLLLQIAQSVGIVLDWQSVGSEAMKQACIDGAKGNIKTMTRLIFLNIRAFAQ
jgi:cell filamentation protein